MRCTVGSSLVPVLDRNCSTDTFPTGVLYSIGQAVVGLPSLRPSFMASLRKDGRL